MMKRTSTLKKVLALVFTIAIAVGLPAQVTTGSILGTVHDQTGAVVPNASVTVTDTGKGTAVIVKSNGDGEYNVPFLIPGSYSVTVESQGFKKTISNNIVLDIDQKARVDVALTPGGANETIEVTTATPLIKSDTSELGDVVGKREVQNLPLNGRNFVQLTYLVPGVTPGQQGENLSGSSSFNPRAASNFNALGSQANTNAYLVDGIDDNEYTFNTVMVQPSVQSIAEFKVLTGTYSAEYGTGSGVLSVSTRSGSNDLHGELFLFLRNSALDARNFFARTGPKPAYRRGQFGAAISAPIVKNKLFIFADYYGQRSLQGITNTNSVPTAAERIGDFSNYRDSNSNLIPIYDPLTTAPVVVGGATRQVRQQFMGCDGHTANVICPNRINTVGLNVASIYPLPQFNTVNSLNNYISTANRIIGDNGGNVRVDYHPSDRDSGFARYSYEDFEQTAPNPLVGGSGTCCLATPAFAAARFDLGPYVSGLQVTSLYAQGLAINETHLFTPHLFNEFRAGYARTNPFTRQSDYGHNSATSLGIMGLNVSAFATGLPNIQIGSGCGNEFTCLQGGTAFLPANPRQTNIQVEDTLSLTHGNNTTKFGFRYVRILASPFTNTTTRGQITFSDNTTNSQLGTGASASAVGGNGIAALLLGFPASHSRNYLQTPYYITKQVYSGFIQDDWKVIPRLTLNLGVRYDVFTPDVEKNNRLANFDLTTLHFIYAGVNGVSRSAGVQTRYNDFGPRVGFAYDVTGRGDTFLRGGFGISYFEDPFSASDELGQNPPYTVSQTFSQSASFPNAAALGNVCTTTSVGGCQTQIQNIFPQGAVSLDPIALQTTVGVNTLTPAVVSHSLTNKTPSMQTYSLGVERQIAGGVVEITYAGSHSLHLTFAYNPNETEPGPSSTSSASRRLLQPIANVSTFVALDPINYSNYNSVQVKYTKRYSHGLSVLMNYTYSKSLDDGGSAASGGGAAGSPQTITNLRAGYGASGFDQKHRFVSSVTYELPFGRGHTFLRDGLLSHVFGGFEVDAITTYSGGPPFSVSLNSGVTNASASWPNRIGSRGKIDHGTFQHFFNTSLCAVGVDDGQCAFQVPAGTSYGNASRSVLYGPATKNWDVALQRHIKLYREKNLAFKLDAFNVFNTKNLLTPNTTIGSANAGVITGTNQDNRDLQGSVTLSF